MRWDLVESDLVSIKYASRMSYHTFSRGTSKSTLRVGGDEWISSCWYGVGVDLSGIRETLRSGGECLGVELFDSLGGDFGGKSFAAI